MGYFILTSIFVCFLFIIFEYYFKKKGKIQNEAIRKGTPKEIRKRIELH